MEKFLEKVLNKYHRQKMTSRELARLIIAHMKVGVDGKEGWHLDLNTLDGAYNAAKEIIAEYGGQDGHQRK